MSHLPDSNWRCYNPTYQVGAIGLYAKVAKKFKELPLTLEVRPQAYKASILPLKLQEHFNLKEPKEGFEPPMHLRILITNQAQSTSMGLRHLSGSGGIRTPCVSYVPDLQSGAHPPSEQHSQFDSYRESLDGFCFSLTIYSLCGSRWNRTTKAMFYRHDQYPDDTPKNRMACLFQSKSLIV